MTTADITSETLPDATHMGALIYLRPYYRDGKATLYGASIQLEGGDEFDPDVRLHSPESAIASACSRIDRLREQAK